MKTLPFLLLLTSVPTTFAWSWDQIDDDIQTKLCTYIVGKIEDDLNSDACDWVVGEVTTYAAGLLAETGVAELVEDPVIADVADHICTKALRAAENYVGVGPDEICEDIGIPWSFRRRREFPNGTTMRDWTAATTARWLTIRKRKMEKLGIPIVVFPDSAIGYCYKDSTTGAFTCMDSGYATSVANSTNAGQVVFKMSRNFSATSTDAQVAMTTSQDTNPTSAANAVAISAAVIFAIGLVACAVYIVQLKKRVAGLEGTRLVNKDEEYAAAN